MSTRESQLLPDEVEALAQVISDCYAPSGFDEVRRPQPPTVRTMKVERPVERQEEIFESVPGGLSSTFYILCALLLFAAIVVAGTVKIWPAIGLLAIGVPTLIADRERFREVTQRRKCITVTEMVAEEKTVEESHPDVVERVPRPPGRIVRKVTRVRLPLLIVPTPLQRTVAVPMWPMGEPITATTERFRDSAVVATAMETLQAQPDDVPHVLDGARATFPASVPTAFGETVTLVGDEAQLASALSALAAALRDRVAEEHHIMVLPPARIPVAALRPCSRPEASTETITAAERWLRGLYHLCAPRLLAPIEELLRTITYRHLALAGVRYDALPGSVAPICADLGRMFHYGAFNFYCPNCAASLNEEIVARDYTVEHDVGSPPAFYDPNTRCVWLPEIRRWQCRTCERTTDKPLPVHKALDELLLPSYDRLMEENKNERLRIYRTAREHETGWRNEAERDVERLHRDGRTTQQQLDLEVRRAEAVLEGEREALGALRKLMEEHSRAQSTALARATAAQEAIARTVASLTHDTRRQLDAVFEEERERMVTAMRDCSRAKRIEDEARDAVFRDIAVRAAEISDHTKRTAAASERTADNTFRTAVASEKTADNTFRTAVASERTADNTFRTAVASEKTADNTFRTAEASEKTADNTLRGAVAAEQTSAGVGGLLANSKEMLKLQSTSNAIGAAQLEAAGVKQQAPWYNPAAQLRQLSAGIESTLLADDPIARSKRRLEAR